MKLVLIYINYSSVYSFMKLLNALFDWLSQLFKINFLSVTVFRTLFLPVVPPQTFHLTPPLFSTILRINLDFIL